MSAPEQPSRERLPNRRRNRSMTIAWRGRELHICAGFGRGRILECFVRADRPETDLDFVVDDVAVMISRLLQRGEDIDAVARGLGRLPGGEPSSLAGAIVDALLELRGAPA